MILALLYSFIHLVLGGLAAVWTAKRMKAGGYTDGCLDACLVFVCAVVAFIFWPFALAVLIVEWAVNFALRDA